MSLFSDSDLSFNFLSVCHRADSALLANLAGDTQLDPHQETTPPFPYVSAIGSPYENVVVTRNSKGTCDFKVSSAADSYITLPRRCPRTSTTSSHSQYARSFYFQLNRKKIK